MFFLAAPADWSDALVFSGTAYASALLGSLLSSPFDFLLTAGAAVAIVVLLLYAVEAWRLYTWRRRQSPVGAARVTTYAITQLLCGLLVALVLLGHQALLQDTVSNTTLDLLHLSLQSVESDADRAAGRSRPRAHGRARARACCSSERLALAGALPAADTSFGSSTVVCWLLPLVVWQVAQQMPDGAASAAPDGGSRCRRARRVAAPPRRPISPWLAGVSPDAAHAAAHRAGIRVLSNRRPAGRPGQDAAGRDALRARGSHSAADRSAAGAEEPRRDRRVPGPRRAGDHAVRS